MDAVAFWLIQWTFVADWEDWLDFVVYGLLLGTCRGDVRWVNDY